MQADEGLYDLCGQSKKIFAGADIGRRSGADDSGMHGRRRDGWFSEKEQGGGCEDVSLWVWQREAKGVWSGGRQDGTAWRID